MHRPRQRRAWAVLAALALQLAIVFDSGSPAAARGAGWEPPVDAEVVDPFRPPANRWDAGNRGLAYGTLPGQPVTAVDAGVVSFAGRVAGAQHVTVDHADGLRSTYAFVTDITVVRGQHVVQGQPLAAATVQFHLTARLGDRYVDPALLLAGAQPVPRLRPGALPSVAAAAWVPGPPPPAPRPLLAPPAGARREQRFPLGDIGRWLADRSVEVHGAVRMPAALVQRVADAAGSGAGRLVSLARSALGAVGPSTTTAAARAVARSVERGASQVVAFNPFVARRLAILDPARAVVRQLLEMLPVYSGILLARSVTAWHETDECTPDAVAVDPPARGRVLIQVGGLGTSHTGASIAKLDPVAIGYDERDVVAFSYAGGCTPVPFGFDSAPEGSLVQDLASTGYSATDTHQDLEVSAARLADLIEEVRAARPGAPIDLAAHSLGGVVTRRALELLAERYDGAPPVSVVVTIGSPHQGAELAGTAAAAGPHVGVQGVLALFAPQRLAEARAESVSQLARGTSRQLRPPGHPPPDVRVVSIAGPGDIVVPPDNTYWDGAHNTIAGPTGEVGRDVHGVLPGRSEVGRELALAVAGLPGRCISFATALAAGLTGRAVALVETNLSLVLAGAPL